MYSAVKVIAAAGILLVCLWLGAKALPLLAPFLVSLAAAAVMEPAVSALCRRGVRRSLSAGLMTCITLLVLCALTGSAAMTGAHLLRSYVSRTPQLLSALTETADEVKQHLLVVLRNVPEDVERELLFAAEGISAQLSRVPVRLSEQALDTLTVFAKQSPDWVLFVCTAVIGIYFCSAYFRDICGFFRRQLPPNALQKLSMVRGVLLGAAGGYLKVQCIISAVTFLVLLAAFRLMGVDGIFPAAAGIAIVDALPILGSGAVMLPWALWAFLSGNVSRGVALVLVYAIVLVLHNLLQAKLMGSHLGLHPVTALVSLYAGWKLGGLWGMLLIPIGCVLLTSLNDAGLIRLYR